MTDHTAETLAPVQTLKGQYVRRKATASKTYKVVGYDRTYGWQLDDCDDASRCIYVKRGTLLFVGFTY